MLVSVAMSVTLSAPIGSVGLENEWNRSTNKTVGSVNPFQNNRIRSPRQMWRFQNPPFRFPLGGRGVTVTTQVRKCRADSKFFLVVWKNSCFKVTHFSAGSALLIEWDLLCQFYVRCKTDIPFSQTLDFDSNAFLNTNLQEKEPHQDFLGIKIKAWWKPVMFPGPCSCLHPEMTWTP